MSININLFFEPNFQNTFCRNYFFSTKTNSSIIALLPARELIRKINLPSLVSSRITNNVTHLPDSSNLPVRNSLPSNQIPASLPSIFQSAKWIYNSPVTRCGGLISISISFPDQAAFSSQRKISAAIILGVRNCALTSFIN